MEINVLCFSIYESQEQTSWAGLTIEDGDVTEFSGQASTALEAALAGLAECVETLATTTPIMIRCSERLPNDIGKKFVPLWKARGFGDEEHKDPIRHLLLILAPRRCLWSKPVLVNQMDQKVQKLAKISFEQESSPTFEEDTAHPALPELPSEGIESKRAAPKPVPTPSPVPKLQKPIVPIDVFKPQPSTIAPTPNPVFPLPSEKRSQAQILLYIDAITAGMISAWGFILIDRQSQYALGKASGHQHSMFQANLLTACVSGIKSLRSPDLQIEIRSRHQYLIQVGQNKLTEWSQNSWLKKDGQEPDNLPYLQALHQSLETITVSWRYISEESEEKGLLDCHNLTQQALNQLNYGESPKLEHRIPKYPIDLLL